LREKLYKTGTILAVLFVIMRRMVNPLIALSSLVSRIAGGSCQRRADRDITSRIRDAQELRESERRFTEMLASLHLVTVLLDSDGNITFCNDFLLARTGWQAHEVLGRSWFDVFVPPDDRDRVREMFLSSLATGDLPVHYENEILTRTGERRLVRWNNTILRDRQGGIVGTASIGEDITEQRRTEEALRAREERYRALFEGAYDAIFILRDGRFVDCNGQALKLFNCTSANFLDRTPADVSPPQQPDGSDSHANAREKLRAALAGKPLTFGWRHHRCDGTEFDVDVSLNRLEHQGGNELLAIVRDVTERRRVEEALRRSETQIRSLMETVPLGIIECDTAGRIMISNATFATLTGYGREEVIGMHTWDFLPLESQREALRARLDYLVERQPSPAPHFTRYFTRDGRPIDVRIDWDYKRDTDGTPVGFVCAFSDLTAGKTAQERLNRFFDIAPAAIAILGWDGSVLYLNQQFTDLIGYSADDVPNIDDWWPRAYPDPEYRDRQKEAWLEAVSAGMASGEGVRGFQGLVRCKDGQERWIETYANTQGAEMCLVLVDVTARKRIEEALLLAKQGADAANRAKSEFLANMSHEIRTPLTAIIGFADLLQETGDRGLQQKYLDMIRTSGDILMSMIRDVLDLAKIEAGKLELELDEFVLSETIERSVAAHATIARQKGVGFFTWIDPAVAPRLYGDAERLRQILANLVSNAVKFTHEGKIAVSVVREDQAVAPATQSSSPLVRLHFSVQDTGIGIPAEKQATIFDSFTQADGSTTRKYGGTGLGTTIAKGLVELMGGMIWLDSTPGVGSTFHLLIPFAPAAPQTAPCAVHGEFSRTARQPLVGLTAPLTILLVEDNPFTQRFMRASLERFGHRVAVAENGLEAVEHWQANEVDLVLMDVQLPEMNGLEATREIRRREAGSGRRTPIVAMTANAFKEDRQSCLAAGMDDYQTKPISVSALLERLLGHPPQVRDAAPEKDAPVSGAAERDSLIALFRLEQMPGLMERDRDQLREFALLLLKDLERAILAICQARRDGNGEELRRSAHTLKGLGAHLCDHTIGRLAAELEECPASEATNRPTDIVAELQDAYRQLAAAITD
jgi:PAS domain S-box-containing protein